MKIRDIEVDFDFLDADDMAKLEEEIKKVIEECKNKEKEELSYSEAIRNECDIIENFFDNVFGEGISEKIFKGKKNLNNHVQAFEDIMNEKIKQQKNFGDTMERYRPNREQRRYNQYKGKRK